MRIHALWCHPRSVSTAFERVMRERGDLDVLHEPFMYHHYLNRAGRLFPGFSPEPGHPRDYAGIRAMIAERAAARPVFFKDMAYYVADDLPGDPGFAAMMSHAFLIRDPAEAIVSYHRRDPDFTREELGHAAQWALFQALRAAGQAPLVIHADDLRADPRATLRRYWRFAGLDDAPQAFEWDDRVPEGWEAVKAWHGEVLQSGAIRAAAPRGDTAARLAALGPRFAAYDAHHRPAFRALAAIAAAQKADEPPAPRHHQK
jgi:hypothetical protein